MCFSTRLRDLRKEKNCTQRQLAEILGLTANSVCEWEKSRSEPSIETITHLAQYFNVSTDYLLGRTDDFGTPVSLHQDLTDEEQSFLDLFRRLSRGERVRLLAFAAGLVGNGRPETESGT